MTRPSLARATCLTALLMGACVTGAGESELFSTAAPLCPKSMLWAHRGLHTEHPENSLAAFEAAAAAGFCGLELDIHWTRGRFLVTHDPPAARDTYPTLNEVFARLAPTGLHIWLDLKSLEALDANALAAAGRHLQQLAEKHRMIGRLLVESPKWNELAAVGRELRGIPLSIWFTRALVGADMKREPVLSPEYVQRLVDVSRRLGFAMVSGPLTLLKESAAHPLPPMPVGAWGFESDAAIRFGVERGVRIMLTDQAPQSQWSHLLCAPPRGPRALACRY